MKPRTSGPSSERAVDLLAAVPPLAWLARRRWFPLVIAVPLLLLAVVLVSTGFVGTPVGNRNGLIVFVWILWWVLLISVLVPFAARSWCGVCPVPLLGDWLQRRRIVGVAAIGRRAARAGDGFRIGRNRYRGAGRRWPRVLANMWLQNLGFLALATVSVLLLTNPLASAVAITGMIVVATAVALVFRQRAFCRYLCPLGGFLSLYSRASTLEVRARDGSVCLACRDRGCVAGNERGWGCPWMENPGRITRNGACGLCLECLKTCPNGNMSVLLTSPLRGWRLEGWDEVWKAYLMLTLAVAYSVVYLGPWGGLKAAANVAEGVDWGAFALYAAGLWVLALGIVPAFYLAAAGLGRRLAGGNLVPIRAAALAGATPLVPSGLLAWIAFSVPLILANGSYVLAAASDPFGWGWDLMGSAELAWTPVVPHWTPWLQAPLVLAGQGTGLWVGWGANRALYGDPRRAVVAFAPTAVLLTATNVVLLTLYTG